MIMHQLSNTFSNTILIHLVIQYQYNNRGQQQIAAKMIPRSKSNPKPLVDMDGHASCLPTYIKQTTNTQICPFLIQSLSPDLQLNHEWMVQLQDSYNDNTYSLLGNVTVVMGTSKVGKHGYAYWRYIKEREDNDEFKIFTIDCAYHSTPYSFVSGFVEQLAQALQQTKNKKTAKNVPKMQDNETLTNRMVVQNNINLGELNKYIQSKPNFKYILVVKNCQLLVDKKRQTVLYTFLQWIKTQIKQRMGLVLITRKLDFFDKLQKRVKSRLSAKHVFISGPKDQHIIKSAILKRFNYALANAEDEGIITSGKRLVGYFQKSKQIESLIKNQQRGPKQIYFFLQAFSIALALNFTNGQRSLIPKDLSQFDWQIRQGFKRAIQHLCPYASRQKHLLQNMNFPQYIIMAIIRKMMIQDRSKICLKQILIQLNACKIAQFSTTGTSFAFNHNIFERALKNLKKIRVLEIFNEKDIQNGQISCYVAPDAIKEIIQDRKDLPSFLKNYLE